MVRRSCALDRATVRLLALEITTRRDSARREGARPWRHVVFEEEVELCRSRDLRAKAPFRLDCEVPIASDAPPSFVGRYSQLEWGLELRFHLAKGPDWVRQEDLFVLP